MKKLILVCVASLVAVATVLASDYNFVSPEKVKTWIETQVPFTIVDIQIKEDFKAHHLPGSLATYAYPVKADMEKAMLDTAVAASIDKTDQIVVVCPRGGGGAKRCYDYMKSKKIPVDRLLILEGGIAGWPYKDILESSK